MTIEIGERTIAMWSVEMHHGNLLAHLGYIEEGKPRLRLDGRFRWYRDDVIDSRKSNDRRSWWKVETNDPPALAIEKFRDLIESLRRADGWKSWELLRGSRTAAEFAEELGKMPNMHVGEPLTEEQYREQYGGGPLEPEVVR
jgi:hypothetical protein